MRIRERRSIAMTWLFVGAAAVGAGLLSRTPALGDEPSKPAPDRMFVVGRVLDPKGQPVPGAMVAVHARSLAPGRPPYQARMRQVAIGSGRADSSGRFRIDAPRTSSSQFEAFGAAALAPGYGVGWVDLDPDDDRPAADIPLRPEQVIQGRLFDLQCRPAADVTLTVSAIRRERPPGQARTRSRFEGIYHGERMVHDFPAWPKPVKTDSEGRFTLRGVGREGGASLAVLHPRFALQRFSVPTDGAPGPKTMTAALAPSQIVNVRVTGADTGQPVPHATLSVLASQGGMAMPDEVETDDEGRCRLNSWAADRYYNIQAYAPPGQPYLNTSKRLEWPKGSLEQSLEIALPRGALIRGRITEEGSGKPVAGASVDFYSRAERQERTRRGIMVQTASDGSFRLGADPGLGDLFVKGPTDDYVLEEIGYARVDQDPLGPRVRAHAHVRLDLKPGVDPKEIHLTLRRGVTVSGQVLGPDGQPVREAWIISRIVLGPAVEPWRRWNGHIHGKVREGRFELHGLDPDVETPVSFLDPERKLGTTVNLSGKSIALMTLANRTGHVAAGATIAFSDRSRPRGPITVRLEPCGAARARFVGPDGEPVAVRLSRDIGIWMVVTLGPHDGPAPDKSGLLFAEETTVNGVDPINYANELVSDAEGRLTLPVLIPGVTYRVIDYSAGRQATPQVRKEFTVKPGEMLDLGEILIEKPPR